MALSALRLARCGPGLRLLAPCPLTSAAPRRGLVSADSVNVFRAVPDLFAPDSPHTALVIKSLQMVHDASGLPWWGAIAVGGVLFRTLVTLPMHVLTERNTARMLYCAQRKRLVDQAIEDTYGPKKLGPQQARVVNTALMRREAYQQLYQQQKCHPAISYLLPLWQFPLWITVSFGLRSMCGMAGVCPAEPGMAVEGFGWMTDLTVPDPYLILPLMLFAVNTANLLLFDLAMKGMTRPNPTLVRVRRAVGTGFNLYVLFLGWIMPQAMCVYWFSSALHMLAMRVFFMYPGVKRMFGIPKTPMDLDKPLHVLFRNLRNSVFKRKEVEK